MLSQQKTMIQILFFTSILLKSFLDTGKKGHHLQTGPGLGPRPRPSKNRTLILRTLENTGPRNLVEIKDQIEYILRYSNFVKKKTRIRIFREKLDLLNMFGTSIENT